MYRWSRRYQGPVRAVVLDWAGTTVDHGCLAPVGVFVEVFKRHGVTVTTAQAREPMGVHKREHIRRMSLQPAIRRAWILRNGAPPNEDDIAAMYALANELQAAVLPEHATPIPGVVELVGRLHQRGIGVGSTSGYPRDMLEVLAAAARKKGYAPDVMVASSDVEGGRPAPWMCWRAAEQLGVWPGAACVKVGDTPVDIEAGLSAGFWTVGVTCTGNLAGMSLKEWASLPADRKLEVRDAASKTLYGAGAHYVIDASPFLLGVLDDIDARLKRGDTP